MVDSIKSSISEYPHKSKVDGQAGVKPHRNVQMGPPSSEDGTLSMASTESAWTDRPSRRSLAATGLLDGLTAPSLEKMPLDPRSLAQKVHSWMGGMPDETVQDNVAAAASQVRIANTAKRMGSIPGKLELKALAKIYGLNICLYKRVSDSQANGGHPQDFRQVVNINAGAKKQVNLEFDGTHYSPILEVKIDSSGKTTGKTVEVSRDSDSLFHAIIEASSKKLSLAVSSQITKMYRKVSIMQMRSDLSCELKTPGYTQLAYDAERSREAKASPT
jgi:hypothetical protein